MALNQPLYCATVTITTTRQNLLALLKASAGLPTPVKAKNADCPGSARGYQLQPDPLNNINILLGDENVQVGPQNCMLNMFSASEMYDTSVISSLAPFGSLWAVTPSGTALLNIGVFGQ